MPKRGRDEIVVSDKRPSKKLNNTEHGALCRPRPTLQYLFSSNCEPVRHSLTSFLNPKSLLALSGVCQDIRSSVRENVWNINSRLGFFVEDPVRFRTLLGRHRGLISGSFALQFFEGVRWDGSDLDLFFDQDSGFKEMIDHLVEEEGYVLEDSVASTEKYDHLRDEVHSSGMHFEASLVHPEVESTSNATQVMTLRKSRGQHERKIQFMLSAWSLRFILREFYTSALSNFITWNTAYAVFPRTTFIHNETFPLKPMCDYFGKLHAKYSQRGWRTKTPSFCRAADNFRILDSNFLRLNHGLDELVNSEADQQEFRVGGKTTWRLSLSTQGVETPPQPDAVIEHASFEIVKPERTEQDTFFNLEEFADSTNYSVVMQPFRSNVLRWKYLLPHEFNWDTVGHLCERLTLIQLFKMKEEDRTRILGPNYTPHWGEGHGLYGRTFDKPDGWWDYIDDEMISLLQRFADAQAK